jgi:ribosomal protein S18 acetylase RimI-like enzyme
MPDEFTITLPVIIRPCRGTDLADLEWFGLLTEYRQTIAEAFQRFQKGESLMLVAEVNHFPAGQVWVDLSKRRAEAIGVLWALRVFIPFQSLGIGTALIASAEERLKELGFHISELGVERDNVQAKQLYERLGYEMVRESVEEWQYTPPGGVTVHVTSEEWIMHKFL